MSGQAHPEYELPIALSKPGVFSASEFPAQDSKRSAPSTAAPSDRFTPSRTVYLTRKGSREITW